jgi:hypothetical protein
LPPDAEDIFAAECLEVAVYRRGPSGSVVGQQQFPPLAAIGDVQDRLAGGSFLSTKFGQVLDPNWELGRVTAPEFPLFVVSSGSSKSITFRDQEAREETFRFDPDVTISDLKQFLSFKYRVLGAQIFANEGTPRDDDALRNLGSTFLWFDGDAAPPQAAQAPSEGPSPAVPDSGAGETTFYVLEWNGVLKEIELGREGTVADAKLVFAALVGESADDVCLLFRGKAMPEHFILSRQRIPPRHPIVVYVRDTRDILRRSADYSAIMRSRPANYEEEVERMARETGADLLECSRYYRDARFDYDLAVANLLRAGPSSAADPDVSGVDDQPNPEYRFVLPSGTELVVTFALGTTVLSAKARIARDLSLAVESMVLMFQGKALNDTRRLETLRVEGQGIAVVIQDDT